MTESVSSAPHPRTLGRRDLMLFSISAILLFDPMLSTAAIGVASLTWWLLMAITFFLPFGLICAELGTTHPEQGGIYAWVRDAFGGRWGSRISWAYWANVAIWNPAQFILAAAIASQLFFPEMPLGGQIAIALALCWACVAFNVADLELGKWVPNVGAFLRIIVIAVMIAAGAWHLLGEGVANAFTLEALTPRWGASLQYVPAVIYGMLGFELVSAASGEMRDPRRDLPVSIAASGAVIFGLYFLGTAAILIAIPLEELNLVESLVTTLRLLLGDSMLGQVLAFAMAVLALLAIFSSAVAWTLGTNRAAAESAEEGELPAALGILHPRHGTPVGAAISHGVICSIVLLSLGLFARSNQDLFWSLFTFSAVLFLLPYVGMMFAFVALRRREPERERPFSAGGPRLAEAMAIWCAFVLILSIGLLIYTPGEGVDWLVTIGSVFTLVIGEVLIRVAEQGRRPAA